MICERLSRRFFFTGPLLAGLVPAGGFGSVPSLRRLGYKSPVEKLNIACIGAGGRAATNIAGCDTENIVAFADPDDSSAAPTYKKYENAARYRDFRRMLDRENGDIDAVIISAPDHVHGVAAFWSMERGKHVYVEKPLTRTVWEARRLTEAAEKYKVVTQLGNQGYSNDGARIAAEIIWSGEIGHVTEVHAWTDRPIWPQGVTTPPPEEAVPSTLDWDLWLGPASMRPYSPAYVPFRWRGFYDFGTGALGDIACHVLGVANLALRLGAPTSVQAVRQEGRSPYTFPASSVIHFQFPARGPMPPVRIIWYDGRKSPAFRPPGLPDSEPLISGPGAFGAGGAIITGAGPVGGAAAATGAGGTVQGDATAMKFAGGGPAASGAVFVGEKGFLTADNYGANVRLLPESRHREFKLPPQLLVRSPGHYRDWIRACKGIAPAPCSKLSVAGPFTEWVLLGTVAVRFDGELQWDGAAMRFTNNPKANRFLKPTFREGWQIG